MKPSANRIKAALTRDVEKAERLHRRELLAELLRQLRDARTAHKGKMQLARRHCVSARKKLGRRAKARRARLLAELRATEAAERLGARNRCEADLVLARMLADKKKGAQVAAERERNYQRDLRRIRDETRNKARALGRRSTAAERESESDDEVRGNIPPELVHLFNKVRRQIKGSPRHSRTEAFLHYAEEHPHEYLRAIEDKTDALVRELEQRYSRMQAAG